ncbi:FAD-dependent oxidoreductase [Candidatus Poribacteria bacterium]
MKSITVPQKEIPVTHEVDVLVVGGGPAGIGAALASARENFNTMLIEQYGFLGGMWTAGLVNPLFDHANKGGIVREIVDRLCEAQGWRGSQLARPKLDTFDPEKMKFLGDCMMTEANVSLLYHTFAVDSVVEENAIKGVIVENKSGRSAILAKIVIDCTGDGDIAARSGAPYEKGRPEDGLLQPMTMMFRLGNVTFQQENGTQFCKLIELAMEAGAEYELPFRNGWVIHLPMQGDAVVQHTHIYGLDATNAADLTKAEIEGRRQVMATVDLLQNHVPEFKSTRLMQTPVNIGVRETRRVMGEYVLAREDLIEGKEFDDGVVIVTFGIDIHDPAPESEIRPKRGRMKPYQIPYGCLVPQKIDNLFVSGRCISGTHEAYASYRVTGDCMAMGEAAGIASALCLKDGLSPRELDGRRVKKLLKDRNILLD